MKLRPVKQKKTVIIKMSPDDNTTEDKSTKSFLGHMEDLRATILWSLFALTCGMIIAGIQTPRIIEILVHPLKQGGYDVETFLKLDSLPGGFYLLMQVAFWAGFVLAMGPILWIVTLFVAPGLTKEEKNFIKRTSVAMVLLFIAGICMAYFMTIPVAINVMGSINEWMGIGALFWKPGEYIGFVLRLMVAFGLAFEMPVVVIALGRMGFVTSKQLRDKRRHVIVGIMIASMLLTPPDPWTMLMMGVPLVFLYEACIWIVYAWEKDSDKEENVKRSDEEKV